MKYPFEDYETAESFIEAIESNPNGHYPIGTSMFWHSGIHIFCDSQKEFEPLIGGKVVCYRISEDYRHVKLPASLGKEELEGKWSDYEGFYDKKGKVKDECKNETYPISDCFILLEHSISINGSDFTFYTLYMNLAPACDNPNYKDLNKDGTIHGHAINPDDKEFFVDEIGSLLPAKDKKQIYFDLVVLSKQSIEDFSSTDAGRKAFWGIKENTHFYQQKGREKVMAVKATLPYEKNPCSFIYIMIAKDDVPNELKKDVKNISETAIHGADGKNYYKVEFGTPQSEEYFVRESDRDDCLASLLDFDKWFYFCKESDSIICDSTELIKDIIEKHDTIIRTAMLMMPIIGIWWTGSKLTWKWLKYVYGRLSSKNDSQGGALTKPEIRKAVCHHPIEWDKNQFSSLDEKTVGTTVKKRLENEVSEIDLWNGGLDKIFSNRPYFYHPIYFINHLEKAGLLFHNPYEGKTYNDIYNTANGDCEGIDMKTKIVDNPGFAPVYDGVNGRKDVEGFAGINGFFNEDYSKVHSNYQQYWHEGVDFAGTEDTVIKSLVFGEIVDFGTHNKVHNGTGMGDYMIVRDAYDKNKYYLLLHLAYESWKKYNVGIGTKVYPGMKVAGVGKPDYFKTAYHLHVSVVVLDGDEQPIDMEMSENGEKIKKTGIIRNSAYLFPIWGHKDKIKDPFNHKEEWKGRKK